MGYYTRHTLTIIDNDDINIHTKVQDYINENEDLEYALGDDFGESSDSCKWYEHENDMRKISKAFPDILFLLEGEGEDSGDMWKEYYLDGKMQRCQAKLTFEEFDKEKLA